MGTDRKASTLSEPTAHSAARCYHDTSYCTRCDLLVGLGDLHVTAVEYDHDVGLLTVGVESTRAPMGCTTCGVIAHSHGRSDVTLVDAPCFDRPVRLVWRKRTWRCEETACATRVFTEQDEQVARPRALLTTRACWWAINQMRREHASISGIARQLGTTWNTVWTSIRPLLQEMADDETRFGGVKRPSVDEHVWHHVSEFPIADGGRGPKLLTGMVDLTPRQGRPRPLRRASADLLPLTELAGVTASARVGAHPADSGMGCRPCRMRYGAIHPLNPSNVGEHERSESRDPRGRRCEFGNSFLRALLGVRPSATGCCTPSSRRG